MEILVDNRYGKINEIDYKDICNKIAKEVLQSEGLSTNVEVSISIVNILVIQGLNKNYRNIDKATDVLSFPLLDKYEIEEKLKSENTNICLGDIVICFDKVLSQANEFNHSVKREFSFMVAHSMLHLLGYDHLKEDEDKVMVSKQENVLDKLCIFR